MKVLAIVLALAAVGSCSSIVRSNRLPLLRSPSAYQQQEERVQNHADRLQQQGVREEAGEIDEVEDVRPGRVEEHVVLRGPSVSVSRGQQALQDQLRKAQLEEEEEERIAQEQAQSAKYNFASAVDDGIMDHSHVRQESRDGNKVTGSYSYSDGFVKRTVNYEADENGYRVVSEEMEPIGDGPIIDLVNGKADVHTQYDNVGTQYQIRADDIARTTSTEQPRIVVNNSRASIRVSN